MAEVVASALSGLAAWQPVQQNAEKRIWQLSSHLLAGGQTELDPLAKAQVWGAQRKERNEFGLEP